MRHRFYIGWMLATALLGVAGWANVRPSGVAQAERETVPEKVQRVLVQTPKEAAVAGTKKKGAEGAVDFYYDLFGHRRSRMPIRRPRRSCRRTSPISRR